MNEIKFDLSNADYAESICENYVSQLLATGKQGLYARPDISNLQNFRFRDLRAATARAKSQDLDAQALSRPS